MSLANYSFPVSQLLAYSNDNTNDDFNLYTSPNYLELGFTSEHIPELLQMATDKQFHEITLDHPEAYAPIHASRILGLLKAETAIQPLISLFSLVCDEIHDSLGNLVEELPYVLGVIGTSAIPALSSHLANTSECTYSRSLSLESLTQLVSGNPNFKSEYISILTQQLASFRKEDGQLNRYIIHYLISFKAVESAPIIEKAFELDCVDEGWINGWEFVQVELGLKSASELPIPTFSFYSPSSTPSSPFKSFHGDHISNPKNQTKRKMRKESRKKNRKKK